MTTATHPSPTSGAPAPVSLWDAANPGLHLGTQRSRTTDEDLEFLARTGARNMALNTMPLDRKVGWAAPRRRRPPATASTWRWSPCPSTS